MGTPQHVEVNHAIQEWSYFKPAGPHDSAKANIEEMHQQDVEGLLEAGDELARLLRESHTV